MKTRFNTYDIICGVAELQKYVGLRVNQIYDIDNKTYLIRLQGGDGKTTLLIESGIRFHTTNFEWPKNFTPSGFSMKLRKHLKNKRLERIQQLGIDRIVDFQFGVDDAAYHIIVELYDRGNILLADCDKNILYILRPHYEGENVHFAVREKYPENRAKQKSELPTEAAVRDLITSNDENSGLRHFLMTILDYGPSIIDHVLKRHNLSDVVLKLPNSELLDNQQSQGKKHRNKKNLILSKNVRMFDINNDLPTLMLAIKDAYDIYIDGTKGTTKGYIIQKREEKPSTDGNEKEYFYHNIEYHPYFFEQCKDMPFVEYESFMTACDEFYSSLEAQKIELKTLQLERDALKKLTNVKIDHEKRLFELSQNQEMDKMKADLITNNQNLVDAAIHAVRTVIANQMPWSDIHNLVKDAQKKGDPVAKSIQQLKLDKNLISLKLMDPFQNNKESNSNDDSSESESKTSKPKMMILDVDINVSAWANARKYYDKKRSASQKQQKTIDASGKALKSAEKITLQTLKDVRTISNIAKARKVFWFEKFYWFISSENYLVIGGRDAQQNELIVKRYMRANDIYVHAEIQGASSVLIRNHAVGEVPPKTLLEAGTMAISYSVAWDAKVVTNAYWVLSNQVSKTAPSGEYLGTGSFMIRGKKNFLPSCHLIMGLSLLFRLEDSFVENHRGERKVRGFEEVEDKEQEQSKNLKKMCEDVKDVAYTDNIVSAECATSLKTQTILSSEEQDNNTNFPDTQVKIEHDTGRVTVKLDKTFDTKNMEKEINAVNIQVSGADIEDSTIISAVPIRQKQKQIVKKRKEEKSSKGLSKSTKQEQLSYDKTDENEWQSKRGQKAKYKKKQNKYKNQDDEERELRMLILKSSAKDDQVNEEQPENNNEFNNAQKQNRESNSNASKKLTNPLNDNDDGEDGPVEADVEMLDTLTGQPLEEDELLFAIPVVAPYQALQNYKFKVKLTPGTGKRGAAAKTAINMFSKDKSCGQREKDLLKSIKDEAFARNIPGKVKISAPQLQKFKK